MSDNDVIRFDEFLFDGEARTLERDGKRVALSPKAFDLLQFLLAQYPRALDKSEIHDHLWPDTVVSHASLPQVVKELRRVLGDSSREPRFIRNVYAFGYAFCGRPRRRNSATGKPLWILTRGHLLHALPDGIHLIGRDESCDVVIPSTTASRRHARIEVEGDQVTLVDLGSKNGTSIGDAKLQGSRQLHAGDDIFIGTVKLTLRPASYHTKTETQSDL
jgi:DNA-binding winged helix-turn-helix (wHTH) protein